MSYDTILVLDFGSQYTQLIARRIRENNVYSLILPYNAKLEEILRLRPKGIILSGGPASVYEKRSPKLSEEFFKLNIPLLGICYGMQLIVYQVGGKVFTTTKREYGKTTLYIDDKRILFKGLPSELICWMSHGDYIKSLPQDFIITAHTSNTPITAFRDQKGKIFGVQFHPEVIHTQKGKKIISNFLFSVCGCKRSWQMKRFLEEETLKIRKLVKDKRVICGVSGGIDSTVTAVLVHKAIGDNLRCIFVDNGLLRKNEPYQVKSTFEKLGIPLRYIQAKNRFLRKLKGVIDPEQKRKIIGEEFIRIFEEEAKKFKRVKFLAQGTLYPDVIESRSFFGGPSAKIKSHHNVGGLPLTMKLELIEPLRELFKDEVRKLASYLGLPKYIIQRQPFPGPGLAIRIIGEVTDYRLQLLRKVDQYVLEEIKNASLYERVWQSFAILLPIKTVGIMGDKRSYEHVVALRCVRSLDGMTADWARIPFKVLERISNRIINEIRGVNRVVYDISSKPPATIEWE